MDLDRIERTLIDFRVSVTELSTLRKSTDRKLQEDVKLKIPLVRRLLEALEPGLGQFKAGGTAGWTPAREATLRGLGLVEAHRQGDEWFAPNTPALQAADMHRLVWTPASTYWQMQDWQRAVEAAYRAIHTQIQQKVERTDLDNSKLFELAFGLRSPANGVRLWRKGDRGTETWRSKQQGLAGLGQALSLGVRNVLTHDNPDLSSAEAMELLGTLSLFGRWLDDCEVARFDDQIP